MSTTENMSEVGDRLSRGSDAGTSGRRVIVAAVATLGLAISGFAAFELGSAEAPAPAANPPAAASPAAAPAAGDSNSTATSLDFCIGPSGYQRKPITLQICFSDGHGWHRGYGHGGYRGGRPGGY